VRGPHIYNFSIFKTSGMKINERLLEFSTTWILLSNDQKQHVDYLWFQE